MVKQTINKLAIALMVLVVIVLIGQGLLYAPFIAKAIWSINAFFIAYIIYNHMEEWF